MEYSMEMSQKLKMEIPYDLAIPLLGIYLKNLKSTIQSGLCTPMFIVALFTTAKTWKQLKCPLTNDGTEKMWGVCVCVCLCLSIYVCVYTHTHIHIMEYCSAIKKTKPSHLQQHGWTLRVSC
uniref:Uncharacterized protein n=1 Tax=Equus caballus TaxID=9796 RepID=A0A9L0TFD5_HORSE